jgi:hypothetical protein
MIRTAIFFMCLIVGFNHLSNVKAAEAQQEFNPFAPPAPQANVTNLVPQPGEIQAKEPTQVRIIDNPAVASLPANIPTPIARPAVTATASEAAPVPVPTPRPAPVKVAQAKKPVSANRLPPITPSTDDEMICDLGHDLICSIQERFRRN